MKLDINENGLRILTGKKEELKCCECGKEEEKIFFCEVKKMVICRNCMLSINAAGCGCIREHIDYKIDNKVIENET